MVPDLEEVAVEERAGTRVSEDVRLGRALEVADEKEAGVDVVDADDDGVVVGVVVRTELGPADHLSGDVRPRAEVEIAGSRVECAPVGGVRPLPGLLDLPPRR